MILQSVTITNLFCYYGSQSFDLCPPSSSADGANILLIWGRNGQGKTSFLNSMKLLFSGVSDDLRTLSSGRRVGPRQYVTGTNDGKWMGILNRAALKEGASDFSVAAQWNTLKADMPTVRAVRTWLPNGDSHLQVSGGGSTFDGDTAEDLLNRYLPRDTLPFFFFDGELIKELADDASGEGRKDAIITLLGLDRLRVLQECLEAIEKDWRNQGAVEEARRELVQLQQALHVRSARVREHEEALDDLARHRELLERREEELAADIEQIRRRGTLVDRERIEQEIDRLEVDLGGLLSTDIPAIFPRAPLLFNWDLVSKTIERLVSQSSWTTAEVVQQMANDLPTQVFEQGGSSSPPLMRRQINFYKTKLGRAIRLYTPETASERLSISPEDAATLRQKITRLAGSRAESGASLSHMSRAAERRSKISSLNAELRDVSDLSAQDRRQLARLEEEKRAQVEAIGANKKDAEARGESLLQATEELHELGRQIDQTEQTVALREGYRNRVEITQATGRAVEELRREAYIQWKEQLEESINARRSQLLTSNDLIRRSTLDEKLNLQHLDEHGQTLGKEAFSAGMKQLLAVSFLWAVSEAAAREERRPVIIDTPLGRLDADHRRLMLEVYLPNVAHQVIVLPTDAEIQGSDLTRILPHVYRQYVIDNPTGQKAVVREGSSPHETLRARTTKRSRTRRKRQ